MLLWLVAAPLTRWAPPVLFARGAWTVLLFAAALPNAWLTIWTTGRLSSLRADQLVPAAALASAAALLPWGVAVILVAAFAAARRERA